MRKISLCVSLILVIAVLSGCGETVNGMVKDTKRIGTGVHKIFVRE